MVSSFAHIVIFGLPIALWFGMITFLCLITAATLGILVLKGHYHVPFQWHMRMAAVTIFFAVIHVILVILQYFF
jgi:membrane protein YdbS with pleckstrin-like domain